MGEGRGVVDPFAAFGTVGEVVQPRDVLPDAACGEVAGDAHQQRDAQHEPEEFPVGSQYVGQRQGVGYGGTGDPAVADHGRVEIVALCAGRVAADGESRTGFQCLHHLGTVKVVGRGQRVERVVEDDLSVGSDERDAQVAERTAVSGRELRRGDPFVEGIEQFEVEELQLGVEPLGLEMLLASVLEEHETGYQRPREGEQQQEEPFVVGEPTPQSRSHSPGGLRYARRSARSCGAGA